MTAVEKRVREKRGFAMSPSARLMGLGLAAAGLAAFAAGMTGRDGLSVAAAYAQQAGAPSTVTAAGITLQSVTIELPSSDRLFPGDASAEAINNNCLACHSAGMVLNQPNLARAAWQAEVEKMRAQYKAPVDPADVPGIVAWLADHKGAR
jgi:hypothetical protein